MMEHIRSVIWYTTLVAVLLVLHHIVTTYRVAVVPTEFTQMEPAIKAGSMCIYKCGKSITNDIERNDIVAFEVEGDAKFQRYFGRVIALPGTEVVIRDSRYTADSGDLGPAPKDLSLLATGFIIPKDTILIGFDTETDFSLTKRLVPFRNVIGRVIRK